MKTSTKRHTEATTLEAMTLEAMTHRHTATNIHIYI